MTQNPSPQNKSHAEAKPVPKEEVKPISLEDLIPAPAELKISDKTYVLRPISLEDQLWASRKFGENMHENLNKLSFDQICQIVYHQMRDEDRGDFPYEEKEGFDDDGKPTKVSRSSWQKIAGQMTTLGHKLEMTKAFFTTVGISQPILDKIEIEEIKKKETQEQ